MAQERELLLALIQKYRDVFAWTYDEMPGLDPRLVVHSLNVDPGVRLVVQPARVFHTEVEAQIIQEVKKLLTVGFIKPIQHPKWLSNIVLVKKKNCHAPNPIPGFVTMTSMLISSLNLILTRTNLTFNKLLQKLSSFFSFLFLYLNDITFNLTFRASTLYLKGSYNPLIIKILNFT